jgi:hypothetical protein
MMSMRYEDMWKLGKVPRWASMTVLMASMRFSDRISSQLNDNPLFAQ